MNTRQAVIDMRQNNRCVTLQQIGDATGITREGARQILVKANLPTRHRKPGDRFTCLDCGNPFQIKHRKGRKESKYQSPYCKKCRGKHLRVTLVCSNPRCGKVFERLASGIEYHLKHHNHQDRYYCSKSCNGVDFGLKHGFGAHPEHRVNEVKKLRQAVRE